MGLACLACLPCPMGLAVPAKNEKWIQETRPRGYSPFVLPDTGPISHEKHFLAYSESGREELRRVAEQSLKTLEERCNARKAELAEIARQKKRSPYQQTKVRKLEISVDTLNKQEQALQTQVDAKHAEASKFGNSTVDMEMLLSDIKNAERFLNTLTTIRDKLRVENRSRPRIELVLPASKPETREWW